MTKSQRFSILIFASTLMLGSAAWWFMQLPSSGKRTSVEWKAYGGTWNELPDEIENSSTERGAKYVAQSNDSGDVSVEANIKVAEKDGEAGFLLRSSNEEQGVDSYKGYFAGLQTGDGTLEIGRSDYGWNPLARVSLPVDADLRSGFHLQAIAYGCIFGVEVILKDGRRTALTVNDPGCIASGHIGLRSVMTPAVWERIQVLPGNSEMLSAIVQEAKASTPLPLSGTESANNVSRIESSLRSIAQDNSLPINRTPIRSFYMFPGIHRDVTIQGKIISLQPLVAIQDETYAIVVPNVDPGMRLKLGDTVLARGTVVSRRFRSDLEDADIRVLRSELPIPPLSVTATQLTAGPYRGSFIELEGTLLSVTTSSGLEEMILRDGDLTFRVIGTTSYRLNLKRFQQGSRLRIQGLATSIDEFTQGVYPFAVVAEEVTLIRNPPWWSPRHVAFAMLAVLFVAVAIQVLIHRIQHWHLTSVMDQREQLAFEMHDSLAQSFTGISYQLNAAKMERGSAEHVQAHILRALEMVRFSHKEASRTIAALRPQLRDPSTIIAALRQIADTISDGGPLKIRSIVSGRSMSLPVAVTDAIFRIGQEAISNAIQHSGCTELLLSFNVQHRTATLFVQDNGQGFDTHKRTEGLGLIGMQNRAAKVHGTLRIESEHSTGTRVTVRVPLSGGILRNMRSRVRSAQSSHDHTPKNF